MNKPVAALLTVAICTGEATTFLHDESLAPQPHVELETTAPAMRREAAAATSSGIGSSELLGHLRQRLLYTKTLRARKSSKYAMLDAFADTAREIVQNRPDLEPWRRAQQYQMLKYEVGLTKMRSRGCRDYSDALPVVAQALGVACN